MVRKQCSETARLYGLTDRGELRTGLRADLNVIDFDALSMERPFIAKDLPTGASRWMQNVSGFRVTMVAGVITYEHGKPTGSLPGRLVRNPRANASAWQGRSRAVVWRDAADNADAFDAEAQRAAAVQRAHGGGASAIARIARDMEGGAEEAKDADAANKSRL